MVYKSRELDREIYLLNLQKEFICTSIRYKVYYMDTDRRHFKSVMLKKMNKIKSIAQKRHATIFNDEYTRSMVINSVVTEFGFPDMIYNERIQPDEVKKQYKFPYSGTMVRVAGSLGWTDYVDFDNKMVYVRFKKNEVSKPIHYKKVERLTLEETDRFYYYSRGEFVVDELEGVWFSKGYNHETDEIRFYDRNAKMHFDVKAKRVRRLLDGFTRMDS